MTFVTKTIKSLYQNAEYKVSCWETTQKNGRTLTIVEHAAIEDIIFNKLHTEGFAYELTPIPGAANHPVVKCVMEDGNGRRIVALGEAHPNSLVNEISRQNPVIMAGNRAFDRAAIRFLNLEGKVYSSEEIPDNEADSEECDNNLFDDEPIYEDIGNAEEKTEPVENEENPGDVVVNFGKYKDKNMTVAQIWETDESWAKFTVNMNTDRAGDATKNSSFSRVSFC